MQKLSTPGRVANDSVKDELARLKAAAVAVQEIRLSAQRELELAKQARDEAQRYQQETEAKARSQAQQIILQARQATKEVTQKEIKELIHREIEELVHNASAEIQKMLADIRTIRIAAQEELATQRKLTDAARIQSLSPALQEKP
jgi:RNA-splicing ligase RtcB